MTRPALFADLSYEAALAGAREQGKLLLVDATAAWCAPCGVMDRTTWVDADVVSWVRENAIAIQLDVDGHKELAGTLHIRRMPTVIALENGSEIDRCDGLTTAKDLVAWLDDLRRGVTSLDRARAAIAANPRDMKARMDLARTLVERGRLDDATEEYAWLWQHMLEHQPAMVGVKHSFMVGFMTELVQVHPAARARFAELRTAVVPAEGAGFDRAAINDWLSLNRVLGDSEATLAWFVRERDRLATEPRIARLIEHRIVPVLIRAERWEDVGRAIRDPLEWLRRSHRLMQEMKEVPMPPDVDDDEMRQGLTEEAAASFRQDVAHLHRGLVAAGRDDEARAVEEEALRVDDSAEMRAALAVGGTPVEL